MPEDNLELSIPKPPPSATDTLIKLNTKFLQRKPPKNEFEERPNIIDWQIVEEQELPVVAEARNAVIEAKRDGLILETYINPLGRIDLLVETVSGDWHIGQSNTGSFSSERTPYNISHEVGSTTREYEKRGVDWLRTERPKQIVDKNRYAQEANIKYLQKILSEPNDGRKTGVFAVDIGDRIDSNSLLGDFALDVLEYIREIRSLKEACIADRDIPFTAVRNPGNHDQDIVNYGLSPEKWRYEIIGPQICYQEIGETHANLKINTNFYDRFWFDCLWAEMNRATPEERQAFAPVIELLEQELAKQEELIKLAKLSGRELVVEGHDRAAMLKRMKPRQFRITDTISGHTHRGEEEVLDELNIDGNEVRSHVVGSPLQGTPGWDEITDPVNYGIIIDPAADEKVRVEIIPQLDQEKREIIESLTF